MHIIAFPDIDISAAVLYNHCNENGSEVSDMSVSLGIHKGPVFNSYNSEFIEDVPVSFQDVWNHVWEPAITACDVHVFRNCFDFTVSQIPEVLEELDRIYDWVQINGGKDTEYISWRIRDELKPFLIQFFQEHKDEDYWFDLG